MKQVYQDPQLEIVTILTEDILTGSCDVADDPFAAPEA